MKIIRYQDEYRDDMIYMYLTAKNALGTVPKLKEDLLDIESNYFKQGGYFWLAIDDNNRVIGCIGIKIFGDSAEVKRLFILPNLKRQGIGTKLFDTLEDYAKERNVKELKLHLGDIKYYFESRFFYAKKGFVEYEPRYMRKSLIDWNNYINW